MNLRKSSHFFHKKHLNQIQIPVASNPHAFVIERFARMRSSEHEVGLSLVRGSAEVNDDRVHETEPLQVVLLQLGELLPVHLLLHAGAHAVFADLELAQEFRHLLHREVVQVAVVRYRHFDCKQKEARAVHEVEPLGCCRSELCPGEGSIWKSIANLSGIRAKRFAVALQVSLT